MKFSTCYVAMDAVKITEQLSGKSSRNERDYLYKQKKRKYHEYK